MEYDKFSVKLSKVRGERRSLNPRLATEINNPTAEAPAVQGLSSGASCE